tara:strand:- start:1977 stop:3191 length:1215 start_codon:yes stop_codon:yes gene_type:complete
MKQKIVKNILLLLFWSLTIIITIVWTYENPEKIEKIKNNFKKIKKVKANSFNVEISKILSLSSKSAFVLYEGSFSEIKPSLIKIFTQDGFIIKNSQSKKIVLPKTFTTEKFGGLKTVFFHKDKTYGLISSNNKDCYYGSIVSLDSDYDFEYDFECLPDKNINFNGLGSSSIHFENKILLTIGTGDRDRTKNSEAAIDKNFHYGKIIQIDKKKLENKKIDLKIFTLGHRNPQGITKVNEKIFSVEHGPKGGDELNDIVEGKNYGWPVVSYGTRYITDNSGKSILINHETNGFQEPMFALIPSVGISSVNKCPEILKDYYKKNCLIALSMYGNALRPGKSLIIFLLNENMDRVHSVEKIYFGKLDNLRFRHFVTNKKNELFEDKNGSIYVSADNKGIYKITFSNFR